MFTLLCVGLELFVRDLSPKMAQKFRRACKDTILRAEVFY